MTPSVTLVSRRASVDIVSATFGVITILGLAENPDPASMMMACLIRPLEIVPTFKNTPVPVPPNTEEAISITSFG